jgi:hypothetical protein
MLGPMNDNEPRTTGFRLVNPDRDAHRILAAIRAYWERTGYLPRLEPTAGSIWLRAPQDVVLEWIQAFGIPDTP